MRRDGHYRRRLRPWVARAAYTILAFLFGIGMGYVAWGAGEDWARMPAHGTWSPQAVQVMDEQGMTWEPTPFTVRDLPRWQGWECRGVPITGRFAPPQ